MIIPERDPCMSSYARVEEKAGKLCGLKIPDDDALAMVMSVLTVHF